MYRHKQTFIYPSCQGARTASHPNDTCASLPSFRGTTILELMIAIAVIVILAGLAMVAVTSTSQMSSSRETENMIRTVMAMKIEYEAQVGERLNIFFGDWSEDKQTIEPWASANGNSNSRGQVGDGIGGEDEAEDYTERLLWALFQSEEMEGYLLRKSMLKMIDDFDGDGFPQLKDAWGKEMRYVRVIYFDMDGNTGSKESPTPDDLVLHQSSNIYGFLISAGPDGYFGDEDPKQGESGWDDDDRRKLAVKHAEDNIVSLDI